MAYYSGASMECHSLFIGPQISAHLISTKNCVYVCRFAVSSCCNEPVGLLECHVGGFTATQLVCYTASQTAI